MYKKKPFVYLSNDDQSLYRLLFFFLAQCPTEHPFSYLNGGYCCKTREERPIKLGITPQNEIDDGTCDGLDFNRQSVCCRDEANTPCPHASGCFDNSDGKYLIHLKKNLRFN